MHSTLRSPTWLKACVFRQAGRKMEKKFTFTLDLFGRRPPENKRESVKTCSSSGVTVSRDADSGEVVVTITAPEIEVHDLAEVRDHGAITLRTWVTESVDEFYRRIEYTRGAELLARVFEDAGESQQARKAAGPQGGLKAYQRFVRELRLSIAEAAVVAQAVQRAAAVHEQLHRGVPARLVSPS